MKKIYYYKLYDFKINQELRSCGQGERNIVKKKMFRNEFSMENSIQLLCIYYDIDLDKIIKLNYGKKSIIEQ